MYLNTLMKIGGNITKGSGYGDRAMVGLQVVAIGIGVVFAVLILLIGILQLFKLFAVKQTDESAKSESVVAPVSAPAVAPIAPAVSSSAQPTSEEELVVAIATAAIAAARGESECAFNVISIKKILK